MTFLLLFFSFFGFDILASSPTGYLGKTEKISCEMAIVELRK